MRYRYRVMGFVLMGLGCLLVPTLMAQVSPQTSPASTAPVTGPETRLTMNAPTTLPAFLINNPKLRFTTEADGPWESYSLLFSIRSYHNAPAKILALNLHIEKDKSALSMLQVTIDGKPLSLNQAKLFAYIYPDPIAGARMAVTTRPVATTMTFVVHPEDEKPYNFSYWFGISSDMGTDPTLLQRINCVEINALIDLMVKRATSIRYYPLDRLAWIKDKEHFLLIRLDEPAADFPISWLVWGKTDMESAITLTDIRTGPPAPSLFQHIDSAEILKEDVSPIGLLTGLMSAMKDPFSLFVPNLENPIGLKFSERLMEALNLPAGISLDVTYKTLPPEALANAMLNLDIVESQLILAGFKGQPQEQAMQAVDLCRHEMAMAAELMETGEAGTRKGQMQMLSAYVDLMDRLQEALGDEQFERLAANLSVQKFGFTSATVMSFHDHYLNALTHMELTLAQRCALWRFMCFAPMAGSQNNHALVSKLISKQTYDAMSAARTQKVHDISVKALGDKYQELNKYLQ